MMMQHPQRRFSPTSWRPVGLAALVAAVVVSIATWSASGSKADDNQTSSDVVDARYLCPDGTIIHARYHIEEKTVELGLNDASDSVTLPIAISGSGARYSDGSYEFWEHHGEATVTLPDGTAYEGCVKQ